MDSKEFLTEAERSNLNPTQKALYDYAMNHIHDDNACGPWGGWVRAGECLKSLGWTRVERQEGHRRFVSLKRPKTPLEIPHKALGAIL